MPRLRAHGVEALSEPLDCQSTPGRDEIPALGVTAVTAVQDVQTVDARHDFEPTGRVVFDLDLIAIAGVPHDVVVPPRVQRGQGVPVIVRDVPDVHALERAAIVAALLVTRVEAITAVENKYRGDFLRDVFLGRAGEEEYVAEHAQAFGWHLDRPVMVVVAVLDPDAMAALGPDPEDRRAWQDRFANAWRSWWNISRWRTERLKEAGDDVAEISSLASRASPWALACYVCGHN